MTTISECSRYLKHLTCSNVIYLPSSCQIFLWHEPSIYISLYVGKDLNMALNQDTRVVLFLLHSTEEVHKKLVIIFWEIYYFRHILVQYVYLETHVQKWETFWYNKNSPSVGTVEKYIQSCNWHGLQPNSVRICTQLQVNSIVT